MATVTETQTFLDELKTPTIITASQVFTGIAAFAPGIGKVIEQAGLLGRLAQCSELAEPDEELRQLYEELFQKTGAMRRLAGDLEKTTRSLTGCLRELTEVADRINTTATALGYE